MSTAPAQEIVYPHIAIGEYDTGNGASRYELRLLLSNRIGGTWVGTIKLVGTGGDDSWPEPAQIQYQYVGETTVKTADIHYQRGIHITPKKLQYNYTNNHRQ